MAENYFIVKNMYMSVTIEGKKKNIHDTSHNAL